MRRGGLPPQPFLGGIVVKVALVWTFIYLCAGSTAMVAGTPPPTPVTSGFLVGVWVTAVTALAVWLELWRRRELLFLANLGYSSRLLVTLMVAQCVALEAAARLLLA